VFIVIALPNGIIGNISRLLNALRGKGFKWANNFAGDSPYGLPKKALAARRTDKGKIKFSCK
jgi:hypothetical protein